MFQHITLLCLGAILNAAHSFDRSTWEAYRKNGIRSRYNIPQQYFSGDLQQHDLARKFLISQNYGNSHYLTDYPREGTDVRKEQLTENARTKLRNIRINNVGRGFLGDLLRKTADAVDDTAKITKDLVDRSAKLTNDVIKGTYNITKKAIDWVEAKKMEIGGLMVVASLEGIEVTINAAWAAHTFGTGLTNQIISDTADWFQGNWEAVKAIEYPGKDLIVLLYPSGLMSVVNRLTKEVMYMMDKAHKMLTHAFAYTLYLSLKIVFNTVNSVMKASSLNCVKLPPQKIKVKENLIDTIGYKKAKACGIAHLKPVNNITITRNDKKLLIVTSPWVLEDLSVRLIGVKANSTLGVVGNVLDNEVMVTKLKRVKATGTVSFEAGTLLRFVRIHIAVDDMEGFHVRFPTKHKNKWMEGIEALNNRVSSLVKQEINHVFSKMEKKVFDYIAHL